MPDSHFEIYRDKADKYRWRFRAGNGQIIAEGGQGYANRSDCENGIESVKEKTTDAEIVDNIEDQRGG